MPAHRRDFSYNDIELFAMMAELKVTNTVNTSELKQAFFKQIKAHHQDKGGEVQKAQRITQAYRILKQYLEAGVLLPKMNARNGGVPGTSQQSSSAFDRSASRPNQQGTRAPSDGFEDFGDFKDARKRRRRKGGMGENYRMGEQQYSDTNAEAGTSSGYNERNSKKMPPKFANEYTYDEEDYSTYDDPMERPDRQKDGVRRIRGGLLLYKDFQRGYNLPMEYQEFGTVYMEDDLVDSDNFAPILEILGRPTDDTMRNFAEKQRVFVYLSWAFDGGAAHDTRVMIQKVKLERISDEDDSLYEITMPAKNFDEELLTSGLHVEVRSTVDGRFYASAVLEQVKPETQTIVMFFVDPLRLVRILALRNTVNITINSSAFVYRSQLRSIEWMEMSKHGRNMQQLVFPKPEFTESFAEFYARRAQQLESMPFRNEADHSYNEEQKNAIYSILNRTHHPWPFLLFGPPGTGKTITLVETIRHLVLQSAQNRILVCTPSKMAADNFAEMLMSHDFLEHKYIFRMHSLSTMAHKRNKKLDPISYFAKEAHGRFFGIPDRLNLKMFRVIICTLATSSYLVSAGGLRGYFTHLIFDEAGQALESEVWIPIGGLVGPQTSVVLAGDPKQLGPVLNVKSMKWFGFDQSMLLRIMEGDQAYQQESADDRVHVILRQTYRSHYSILRPCSYLFYNNMLVVDDSQGDFHRLCEWEGLPAKGFPIIFHSSVGSRSEQGVNKSFANDFEAKLVCEYVERLLHNNTDIVEKDIGVISPYKNQVIKLRHMLASRNSIIVDSVEGFQGSERAVIIMSMVRQFDMGFLRCDLRLNTSISRAKYLLIVIGNEKLLSQHTTWKKFIYYCRFHGGFLDNRGEKMAQIEDEPAENGNDAADHANVDENAQHNGIAAAAASSQENGQGTNQHIEQEKTAAEENWHRNEDDEW